MINFSTVNKTNFESKKKKGLGYFRHKIKSENKKHPLYQTFIESPFSSFNHGCDKSRHKLPFGFL